MKRSKLLFLLVVLLSMISYDSFAYNYDYDIVVGNADGVTIYYNFINNDTELEVTGLINNEIMARKVAYSGCVNIPEEVTYMNKTYRVTSIGDYAFWSCQDLTSVTIPYSVTSIGNWAFIDCIGLKTLSIPNNVTIIGSGAFSSCRGLTSINIPPNVTSIGGSAFSGCSGLKSIVVPNGVESINSETFEYCRSLSSVIIPNSVTSIGSSAFSGTAISSIDIPNSVTFIGGDAFKDTPWFNNQPDGLVYINKFAYKYKGEMPPNTEINIIDGTTTICGNAFQKCSNLTSINLANSVTTIGKSAFYGCTGLSTITIPNSVTSIEGFAFSGCTGLSTITIPNSVTSIEGATFYGCTGLSTITIPNNVTSIGGSAFEGCTGLSTITIPNNVTSIELSTFSGCSNLESITIPNSVTTIGSKAFSNCESLSSITFGSNLISIYWDAFKNCKAIRTVRSYIKEPFSVSNNLFDNGTYRQGTLYIPKGTEKMYFRFDGWKEFLNIVEMSEEDEPDIPGADKCATPTIIFEDGKITFKCETEGVEFVSNISASDTKDYNDAELTLSYKYMVSVFATKEGYNKSDVITREIVIIDNSKAILVGDVNQDGKVDVADHVKLSDIIMGKE